MDSASLLLCESVVPLSLSSSLQSSEQELISGCSSGCSGERSLCGTSTGHCRGTYWYNSWEEYWVTPENGERDRAIYCKWCLCTQLKLSRTALIWNIRWGDTSGLLIGASGTNVFLDACNHCCRVILFNRWCLLGWVESIWTVKYGYTILGSRLRFTYAKRMTDLNIWLKSSSSFASSVFHFVTICVSVIRRLRRLTKAVRIQKSKSIYCYLFLDVKTHCNWDQVLLESYCYPLLYFHYLQEMIPSSSFSIFSWSSPRFSMFNTWFSHICHGSPTFVRF